MVEKTITIDVMGSDEIPSEIYELAQKLPPLTQVTWRDLLKAVEYRIEVSEVTRRDEI